MKAMLERKGLALARADLISFYANARARAGSSWILTEAYGGILWEIAVHDIYLGEYMLGPIKRVHAVGNRINQPQPDSITILLQSCDAVAVCQTEWNVAQPAEKLQLVTRQGDRFITDFYHDGVIRRCRVRPAGETSVMSRFCEDFHEPLANWSNHLRDLIKLRSYQMARPSQRTFFVLIQELVSYLNGENDVLPTRPEDGLRAVRVLEAAKRSIETGTTQSTQ
jgi:predicted dehydrogenase